MQVFRYISGTVGRLTALTCVGMLALSGCSDGDEAAEQPRPAASEPAEPSGPEDPRLQGEPLTEQQASEELCDQIVEYFPDDMVAEASTAPSTDEDDTCEVDGVEAGSGVTVKFNAKALMLASTRSIEEIDANLRSDDPVCDKVLFSSEAQSRFLEVHDPRSFGERPDEYCGIKFEDEGHMAGLFIQNAQHMYVLMWVDAPDSVEQYDVREEIMPYIMEGVKNFHSDQ